MNPTKDSMGRSRSRSVSPSHRRRKSRDREWERDRNRDRKRKRSRERTDRRRSSDRNRRRSRSRSRSKDRSKTSATQNQMRQKGRPVIPEVEMQGKTEDEKEMMRVMGFSGFDTTKGKKVPGNVPGDVHVIFKRKYRQYMNRKGGFNRPLDFVA